MSYSVTTSLKLSALSNDQAFLNEFKPIVANLLSPNLTAYTISVPPLGNSVEVINLETELGKYPVSLVAISSDKPFDVSTKTTPGATPSDPVVDNYTGNYSLVFLRSFSDIATGIPTRYSLLDTLKVRSHPLVDTAFTATIFVAHGKITL